MLFALFCLVAIGPYLCGFGFYLYDTRHRFDESFDLGHGATLRVWAEYTKLWPDLDGDGVSHRVMYRIDRGDTPLVPPTELAGYHPSGSRYPFRLVFTDDGQLAYLEGPEGTMRSPVEVLFDHRTGESWPADYFDGGPSHNIGWNNILAKWRPRFEQVKREHPDVILPNLTPLPR